MDVLDRASLQIRLQLALFAWPKIRKKVRFKFNLIRFTAQARDARLCK